MHRTSPQETSHQSADPTRPNQDFMEEIFHKALSNPGKWADVPLDGPQATDYFAE